MDQTYLYAIIDGWHDTDLGITGVDGTSPVYTIPYEGIGCVVSDYRGEEFGALSRERLIKSLLAHQRAVERVMQAHNVLPVKFGTVLQGAHEALQLLAQGYTEFQRALADVRDKVEMEVAATWETGAILAEIGEDGEVVRLRESITRGREPTVEERLQLGHLVKHCMDQRREGYRERMVSFLRPFSVDMALNAIVADDMVMNVAFLVDRAEQHQFDTAVHQLDQLFQDGITFRVIGPLPPYSFSTVQVTGLRPEQLDPARHALLLEDVLSEAEVRTAYRRLAAKRQQGMKPEETESSELARLRGAAELLLRYCRARRQACGKEWDSRLGNKTNTPLFFIEIKGRRGEEIDPRRFGRTALVGVGL